jgi:hypothetical protein
MRLRITNISTQTRDVRCFSFESAGALALLNEYSGFAVRPAHYIAFAERKPARPVPVIYHFGRCLMSPLSGGPFTAFVGIDWADAKHDVCMQAANSEQREFACFPHQVSRIEQWANEMRHRFGGTIAVALELAKGPIVYALQKYHFFVLFPINPATLAKYREAFKPSRAKDDPTDAELALDLLLRHGERFKPPQPQSAAMRMLLTLVEKRRELVNDKNRYTNRLCNTLKQYYPQAWNGSNSTTPPCSVILSADGPRWLRQRVLAQRPYGRSSETIMRGAPV